MRKSRRSPVLDSEDTVFDVRKPTKTYSRKRKLDTDDYDIEDGDDEDDFADKIMVDRGLGKDSEYTPKVEVLVSGTRVMPRRSNRGKHSKYDEDYVYNFVKKEPKEEVLDPLHTDLKVKNEPREVAESVLEKIVVTGGDVNAKRGRGRPKKIPDKIENKPTEKEVVTLSKEVIQVSLLALKAKEIDLQKEKDVSKAIEETPEQDTLSQETNESHKDKENNESENVNINENKKEFEVQVMSKTEADVNRDTMVETNEIVNKELKVTDNINEYEVLEERKDVENGKDSTDGMIVIEGLIVSNEVQSNVEKSDTSVESMKEKDIPDVKEKDVLEVQKPKDKVPVTTEEKGSVVVMFEEADDGSYGCAVCDERFTNELAAISHFMQHDQKGNVSCKMCRANFDNVEALLEHRKECAVTTTDVTYPADETEDKNTAQYVCDICKQAFRTAQYLYRHLVIHTDVFQCEQCSKTFSRKDSMQKHILKCCPSLAEKYKIFYCEVCLRVFSKESGKRRHTEKCKSVQCKDCLKIFVSQADLELHTCKMFDLDDSAKYCCGRCAKAFQSLYYLKQHQQLHDNHNSCERCGKSFLSNEELESHKGLCETLEGIRLYGAGKCSICFETFSNSKHFRNHFMLHTHPFQCDKCEKRFLRVGALNSHDCEVMAEAACSVCSKTFKNQSNLERHIKENGCMRYQCSACSEQFRSKGMAKDHNCIIEATEGIEAEIVSINNVKEVCPTCGKSFSSKSNLTKHMILHGEKKYGCPHCPKFFHLDVYLKEHITCVHYKIFKYQCNVCGRLLKSKTGLIAHTRIFHAKNSEAFPCTKCKKVFKQKGNLRSHMYSHSKERNFKCDICIKAFKYPDQLSRHKLEHKLLPKINCPHCDKEFLRTYDLKKHLQVYHSGYIYVCGICSARCGHRHTLTRHYKRKHPESMELISRQGYVDNLLKHVSEIFEPTTEQGSTVETKCIVLDDKLAGHTDNLQIQQGEESAEMLSQDAAEALQNLTLGCATAQQIQLLKEKGLFIQGENGLCANKDQVQIQDQGQVIIPQDSYIFEGHTSAGGQILGGDITASAVGQQAVDGNIGMIHNTDGSININGIQGIPQTIEGLETGDGQIVILQIVDPDSQDMQGEIIQLNQDQHGNIIQLNEEQQEKLLQLNETQSQIIQINQEQTGEVIPLNQTVFQSGDVYHATPLDQSSQVHTVVVDSGVSNSEIVQEEVNQDENTALVGSEQNVVQTEAEKLPSIPVISLEGGDPNIQAPMVYSQDVTCSDEIE